jgi:hypothetical protein
MLISLVQFIIDKESPIQFIKTPLFLSFYISIAFSTDEFSSSTKHVLSSLAPNGHWAIRIEGKNRSTKYSYNNSGNQESIGANYNGLNLNKDVFSSLALFGEGATLGTTKTEIELESSYTKFMLGYGITKNITVGVIIPYREKTTKVKFSISGGTIGVNPNFNPSQVVSAHNLPYLPISEIGVNPITTAQLQALLASKGLEYKPLQSIRRSGLADPTIGLLWNAYHTPKESLVFSTGYDIAMAKKDDPDNLISTNIGNGNSAIRLRLEYFRDLEYDFDTYGKFEYGIELEDTVRKRVPKKGEFLAPKSSTERLNREIGDYRFYDIGIGKTWGDYRLSTAWRRSEKDADVYQSLKGTDVSMFESHTKAYVHQFEGSFSWSGVEYWKKGNIPFPLVVKLNYRNSYEGKNALKWKEVYLNVTSFF